MKKDKSEELRGGLAALLGNTQMRDKIESLETKNIIDEIEDEKLKDAIVEKQHQVKRGRPRKNNETSEYIRITTIVNEYKWEKVKQISRDADLTFKEVMDAILDIAIEAYESKNGEIKTEKKQPKTDASRLFK